MPGQNILLVEDEQAIADTLIYALEREGYAVCHVTFGDAALHAAHRTPCALVILDVGLPDMSGFDVLRALRAAPQTYDLPVLFLTARSEEIDRILGLELGADDYVSKPFSPREIVARVRAILRRDARGRHADHAALEHAAQTSPWQHDAPAMRIAFCGTALALTRYEYRLLALLLSSPGRVYSREQIMDRVWSDAPETGDRSIDTHIKTLRAKLRAIDGAGEHIVTHRGSGYRLVP